MASQMPESQKPMSVDGSDPGSDDGSDVGSEHASDHSLSENIVVKIEASQRPIAIFESDDETINNSSSTNASESRSVIHSFLSFLF
jgi:hypothetical protein